MEENRQAPQAIHVQKRGVTKLDQLTTIEGYDTAKIQDLQRISDEKCRDLRNFSPTSQVLWKGLQNLCGELLSPPLVEFSEAESSRLKGFLLSAENALFNKAEFAPFINKETPTICTAFRKLVETQVLCDIGDDLAVAVDLTRTIAKIEKPPKSQLLAQKVDQIVKGLDREQESWIAYNIAAIPVQAAFNLEDIKYHRAIREASLKLDESAEYIIGAFKGYNRRNSMVHNGITQLLIDFGYGLLADYLWKHRQRVLKLVANEPTRTQLLDSLKLLTDRWYCTQEHPDTPGMWDHKRAWLLYDRDVLLWYRQKPPRTAPIRPPPREDLPSILSPINNPPVHSSVEKSPSKRLASLDLTQLAREQGSPVKRQQILKAVKELSPILITDEDKENVQEYEED